MLERFQDTLIELHRQPQPPDSISTLILRAEGLSKSFGGVSVLKNLNLTLRTGEVVLLQGANGSGKTTLLNVLTGLLEPDSGLIEYWANGSSLRFAFPRRWWQAYNPFDGFKPENLARMQTGRTWQDVRLFGSLSLKDNIAVAAPGQPGENPFLALVSPKSYAREAEVSSNAKARLASLGLIGRELSSADKISLGQSKRVAIARAINAGARLLFLDEPLAGLDRDGIADVVELLHKLVQDHQTTLVIVEHVFNQPHLHSLTTTEWVMEKGKLFQSAGNERVFANSLGNSVRSRINRPGWFPLLAEGAEIVDESLPRGAVLTRIKKNHRRQTATDPVLKIRDLTVLRGSRMVVGTEDDGITRGLSLDLHSDEIVLLQAPNGWGKSSLLGAIAGLLPVSNGDIVLHGKSMARLAPWDRVRMGLSYLSSTRPYFEHLSASENLALANNALWRNASRVEISSLSGGQRQHLALKAVINSQRQHRYLMLDEPFVGLDADITRSVCQEILTFSAQVPCLIALPLT
jgi:branched-chain amino acid transport system ATP-binding protein